MRLIKSFIQGIMNKDLDERLIPDGQYRDALNIEVSASEGAGVGALENIKGNTNVSNQTFTANAKTIGAVADEANNNIYWFVNDPDGAGAGFDYVLKYNEINGITTVLLKDTIGNANSVLKFNPSYLITGVNIIDDLLFWTDNINPPRRLNVTNYYATDDFIEDDISVIVKPAINSPTITLSNSAVQFQENNLKYKFLQFACRYKYENDEYSAISPFSSTAFEPSPFLYVIGDDSFSSMTNSYNQVDVNYYINGVSSGGSWVPDERIKEVQLLFRDTAGTNINVIQSFDVDDIIIDGTTGRFTNTFDNSKVYTVLPPDEITRLFDNVPLLAKAQELIGSRIAYGNYVQFYDIVDSNGVEIDIDYRLKLQTETVLGTPLPTFRSDRDYEIGIVYLDDYSRMTTVLTAPKNTINITPANSDTANDIRVMINNEAPSFASKYRIFIKQPKGNYYNIFVLYYYRDGLYTWFEIDQSEVDKVPIGSYVILKTDAGVASESNQQYKVLDVQAQPEDFLDNDKTQRKGLYFKLKVDDATLFDGSDITDISHSTIGTNSVNNNNIQTSSYILGYATGQRTYCLNYPIYYGNSTTNNVITPSDYLSQPSDTLIGNDRRLKIIIDTPSGSVNTYRVEELKVTPNGGGYQLLQSKKNITTLNQSVLDETITGTPAVYNFSFDYLLGYRVGDYWIVNIHSNGKNNLSGETTDWTADFNNRNQVVIPQGNGWDQGVSGVPQVGYLTQDRPIKAGARITLNINDVSKTNEGTVAPGEFFNSLQTANEFISPRDYINIEEWFWESGAYLDFKHEGFIPTTQSIPGGDVSVSKGDEYQEYGPSNVFFRRGFDRNEVYGVGDCASTGRISQTIAGQNPPGTVTWAQYLREKSTWMCIKGTGSTYYDTNNCDGQSYIGVSFRIEQQEKANVFETTPIENPADIYYELSDTFDIINGAHQGNVSNQSLSSNSPAQVSLNTTTLSSTVPDRENSMYNAYCFGNGVEGLRIRGDFNAPALAYSPRVSSVIEDYQQQRVEEAITYSGIYRENTGINNLNEFNLSLANFKYLDKFFGSIQKLHARDTDIVTFQENKVSKILYGKNLLSDSVGGGVVASIPEVLGTQVTYTGEYGISENPESFATWGNDMYFTDSRRGAVMRLGSNGMFEISSQGMRDYFKDLFVSNSRTQKIGAIDPFKERYVLANNDTLNPPCNFKVSPPLKNGLNVTSSAFTANWNVSSNTEWTVSWVGATWLTVNTQATPYSGEDSEVLQLAFDANATGSNRSVTVIFQACGVSYPFTITQHGKTRLERKIFVVGNGVDTGLIANQKYDFTSNTTGGDIDFDGVRLTKNSLALNNSFRSFEGVDSIPASGDTVTIKAAIPGTATIKPFNPLFGNSLRYYVSNTEYTEDNLDDLLLLSTAVTPAVVGSNYQGSFTFTRTTEKYLYLIYDYRNNDLFGATPTSTILTSNGLITGDVNSIIDYEGRSGNITLTLLPGVSNRMVVKWNDQIVGDTGSVAVSTPISFLKNELLPGSLDVLVEGGGAFRVQGGPPILTSFLIDLTDDDITTVCPRVPASTRYHSGAAALPVVGDIIFNEPSGATRYNGNNAFHKVGAADDYVVVNGEGTVIVTGDCAACAEVAVPVINQPAITLNVGDAIDLKIPVSNNPISFAVSTTCSTYQLNGGADGALFTTTDCTTGATIETTVTRNSFQEICTTTVPVLVSGTGTSSLVGTCDDEVFPPGITLDKLNGIINGTANTPGIYTFRITATNCFGTSALSTLSFTINPNTTNKRFNMDSSNPETTSGLACAVTPSYSIFYHNGQKEYPEVNDFIFNFCECEQRIFNGGYLWYVTDELTGVKNNVIRIDSVGQVVEKTTCP